MASGPPDVDPIDLWLLTLPFSGTPQRESAFRAPLPHASRGWMGEGRSVAAVPMAYQATAGLGGEQISGFREPSAKTRGFLAILPEAAFANAICSILSRAWAQPRPFPCWLLTTTAVFPGL